jgi:hypothetical protein
MADNMPTGVESQHKNPSMIPNGKATAAVPKLSDDDNVELNVMLPTVPDPDEDIMQLARLGDISGIQKLFDGGKFDITYCDEEGITPLHVIYSSGMRLKLVLIIA